MEFSTFLFNLYILFLLFYEKLVNICFLIKFLVSKYSHDIELHETACSRRFHIYKYLKGKPVQIRLPKEKSWTLPSGINHHEITESWKLLKMLFQLKHNLFILFYYLDKTIRNWISNNLHTQRNTVAWWRLL